MQSWVHVTKFMNAGLQSLDIARKTLVRPNTARKRALREGETPAESRRIMRQEAMRVYGTAIGAITIPTILLYAANFGDEEIEDLRKSEGGRGYNFYRDPFHPGTDGKGQIVRWPKPFLYGQIFGTGVESVLDVMLADDPEAIGRWLQGIATQGAVNMVPDALKMSGEQWANKDYFFNSPLVPEELEGVEPGMQFTERTSRVAIKIGERFPGVSPIRIEKLYKDTFGTMPVEMLRYVDRAIDRFNGDNVTEPAPMRGDMLFFGRFFSRVPSTSVEPVRQFWDNAMESQEALNSLALAEKREDFSKAEQLLTDRMPDFLLATLYEGARGRITDLRNSIDAVRVMPDEFFGGRESAATEKRELIDEFMRMYIQTARDTNEAARLIRAEFEAANEAGVP
jgi:hypothetical protein